VWTDEVEVVSVVAFLVWEVSMDQVLVGDLVMVGLPDQEVFVPGFDCEIQELVGVGEELVNLKT
jgi:hypothetical protein